MGRVKVLEEELAKVKDELYRLQGRHAQVMQEAQTLKGDNNTKDLYIKDLAKKVEDFEKAGQMRAAALGNANLLERVVNKQLPILRQIILDYDRQTEFQNEILEIVGCLQKAERFPYMFPMGLRRWY